MLLGNCDGTGRTQVGKCQHYATMGCFCRVCGPGLRVTACRDAYQLLYMPHFLWAEEIIVYERALKFLGNSWRLLEAKRRRNEVGGYLSTHLGLASEMNGMLAHVPGCAGVHG